MSGGPVDLENVHRWKSWKMNGRAEAEVGMIRRMTKTLFAGTGWG